MKIWREQQASVGRDFNNKRPPSFSMIVTFALFSIFLPHSLSLSLLPYISLSLSLSLSAYALHTRAHLFFLSPSFHIFFSTRLRQLSYNSWAGGTAAAGGGNRRQVTHEHPLLPCGYWTHVRRGPGRFRRTEQQHVGAERGGGRQSRHGCEQLVDGPRWRGG